MTYPKDFKYERFDVEISYKCPNCGTKWFMSLDPSSTYAVMEYGLDIECDKCKTMLTVNDF